MAAVRLFSKLTLYYVVIGVVVFLTISLIPWTRDYLPVGGVEALITQPPGDVLKGTEIQAENVGSLGESLFWLLAAIIGALLTALPVSWVYMEVRHPDEYDQSLIGTIIMLPLVVTSIVIIVQNSLALAFALAGIAGAVRFRNSLKSSGDALFILCSVGIGLSAGIGAVELSIIMSVAFNYCFLALWLSEYGERKVMKRYMSDFDPGDGQGPAGIDSLPQDEPEKTEPSAPSTASGSPPAPGGTPPTPA
jgi:hypothetical protein